MPWESMLYCGLVATLVTVLLCRLWKGGAGSTKRNAIVGGLFTVSQTLFSGTIVASNSARVFHAASAAKEAGEAVGFWALGGVGGTILGFIMSIFIGCCVFAGITCFCGLVSNDRPQWLGSSVVAVVLFTLLFMAVGI